MDGTDRAIRTMMADCWGAGERLRMLPRIEVELVDWRSRSSSDVVEADLCLYDDTTTGRHMARMGGADGSIRTMMADCWGAGERLGRLRGGGAAVEVGFWSQSNCCHSKQLTLGTMNQPVLQTEERIAPCHEYGLLCALNGARKMHKPVRRLKGA